LEVASSQRPNTGYWLPATGYCQALDWQVDFY